ncbi:MAG: TIGR01777 family oxidoreductase [Micrococcus sp.]|nr:TIGR01777 family oxidoreductase [Micrococcus sp.]
MSETHQHADDLHTFEHRTALPFPREVVFQWLMNPGAVVRLNPPFASTVEQEPAPGIPVGTQTHMRIFAPGGLGLLTQATHSTVMGALPSAVAKLVPQAIAPDVHWVSRHTELVEGHHFVDEMVSGPLRHWRHTHTVVDADDDAAADADQRGCVVVDHIEYGLPAESLLAKVPGVGPMAQRTAQRQFEAELQRQFAYRGAVMRQDLAFHAAHPGPLFGGEQRTVAVTGAGGLVGTALCALLGSGGHRVLRLVRDADKADGQSVFHWDPTGGHVDDAALEAADVVVNLAGESIAGRMTEEHKQEVYDSRVRGTTTLVRALQDRKDRGASVPDLVNGSAVGYYGADAGAGPGGTGLTEILAPGEDILARVCRDWEKAAAGATSAGARTAMVRTGIVLDPAGGLLQQLLPIFLAGLGGPMATGGSGPDGTPWMSWITLSDIVGIFATAVLDDDVHGPLNGAAPEPVTLKEFASTLGAVLKRPAVLPVPSAGPSLLLGREGYETLVAADQKTSAEHVQALGYEFRHPTLREAFRHILGR